MLLNHPPNKVLVTGQGGTGKTSFWTRYVCNSKHDYHFIFDSEGEFVERSEFAFKPATTPEELERQVETGWIVYDPVPMYNEDFETAFAFFCDWFYQLSNHLPGTKLFACDELQELVGVNSCPIHFRRLLRLGRRRGIDAIMIAQEPNGIHNVVRNQLTEVVAFQQLTENAIEFLAALGFDPEELRSLDTGDFVDFMTRRKKWTRGNVFKMP